ncbi:hypothetical protein ACH4U6_10620 [Streptomyces netropsis]|uniref:hypothetical protein n=1 Tax=Streptomyces netropsis TaxID=55404 RepID=UPI0037959ACE
MPTPMPRIPRSGGHPSASSPLSALLYALSLLSALVLLAAFPSTSVASAGHGKRPDAATCRQYTDTGRTAGAHDRHDGSCARLHALAGG